MKITNTQKGPRGVNTVNGPMLVEPGETIEANVYEREKQHIKASGWFDVDGDFTANPGSSAATVSKASDELEALKAQLAERDAELAKLKAAGSSDRDDLKKQADELGLQYPGNISNAKLKELIDAKLAS